MNKTVELHVNTLENEFKAFKSEIDKEIHAQKSNFERLKRAKLEQRVKRHICKKIRSIANTEQYSSKLSPSNPSNIEAKSISTNLYEEETEMFQFNENSLNCTSNEESLREFLFKEDSESNKSSNLNEKLEEIEAITNDFCNELEEKVNDIRKQYEEEIANLDGMDIYLGEIYQEIIDMLRLEMDEEVKNLRREYQERREKAG